jgi:CxC2 like cysteine cluster associated with KDZ transposases
MPLTNLACSSFSCIKAGFCCLDCYELHWWCQSCLILHHAQHPFHHSQQWKEGSFENVSLCDLGYVFILGHSSSGHLCPDNDNLFEDCRMTVIHVNGVFDHCIRFCHCPGAASEHEQLFCHWLFPSTFNQPETAFTLSIDEHA